MKWINKNTIKLDKVENELDRFVLEFVKILEKHVRYVIISGYVAILFGRNRASEDIGIFVNEIGEPHGSPITLPFVKARSLVMPCGA